MLLFFNFIYRKYVWAIINRFICNNLYINGLQNTDTPKPLSDSMVTIYKDSKVKNDTGIV